MRNDWIPVTERLPETLRVVEVKNIAGEVYGSAYMGKDYEGTSYMFWKGVDFDKTVTHWRPLNEDNNS